MRKLVLFGVVLALFSGCGRGWLPFRGAPCNSNGCGYPPAVPASYDSGCTNCPTSAGYGEYSGEYSSDYSGGGIVNDNNYYGGGIVGEDYPIQGSMAPSMQPLSQPSNNN